MSLEDAIDDVTVFMKVGGQPIGDRPRLPEIPKELSAVLSAEGHGMLYGAESIGYRVPDAGEAGGALLGVKLMMEELGETVQAMAIGDLAETADGLADLIYVTLWTAIRLGIDLAPVWNAVQNANMAKFPSCEGCGGEGVVTLAATITFIDGHPSPQECWHCGGTGHVVIRDASGKVQKPAGWQPPDIKAIIAAQVKAAER